MADICCKTAAPEFDPTAEKEMSFDKEIIDDVSACNLTCRGKIERETILRDLRIFNENRKTEWAMNPADTSLFS